MATYSAVFAATAALVAAALLCTASALPNEYVDTRIGSGGAGFGVGSLNPGPQVPFGAMRLGPDTSLGQLDISFNHFGGYYFNDTDIRAFSHTHMVGAGVEDLGTFGVMATRSMSKKMITDSNYMSAFSHDTETAVPGYYGVHLETPNVDAEVTVAGTMSGMHRYTFQPQAGADNVVLIDVCHTIYPKACKLASVQIMSCENGTTMLSGSVKLAGSLSQRSPLGGIMVYFHMGINASDSCGVWADGALLAPGTLSASSTANSLGAYVMAPTSSSPVAVDVHVGISFISASTARANLMSEQAPNGNMMTFEEMRESTTALWNSYLTRVTIDDPNASHTSLVMFYSGLYRSFLAPTSYSEADGTYLGFDNKVHVWPAPGSFHSDMSLWDIHRSQVPLLSLMAPDRSRDTARSLVAMTQQGGKLPRWPLASIYTGCMVGSHGVVAMADAVVKGVQGMNVTQVAHTGIAAVDAQDHSDTYMTYGYVPTNSSSQGASLTLDYAFDDWAASQLAAATGQPTVAASYKQRSQNYRNVWQNPSQYFCPKDAEGKFSCPWIQTLPYPIAKHYTEGDGEQYRWFVPQDTPGLIELFGSNDTFAAALNTFFAKSLDWKFGHLLPNPYYWAGNEPDLLAAWQFNYAGAEHAHQTQYWSRKMLEVNYNDRASGVPGNDDYGTMSAWECWAFMGLYPLSGSTTYSIGAPAFAAFNVTLPTEVAKVAHPNVDTSSDTVTLVQFVAHNASATNVYVQRAVLNGVQLPTPFLEHDDLIGSGKGGVFELWMTNVPHAWNGPAL